MPILQNHTTPMGLPNTMFLVRQEPARVRAKTAEAHRPRLQADDTVPRMDADEGGAGVNDVECAVFYLVSIGFVMGMFIVFG